MWRREDVIEKLKKRQGSRSLRTYAKDIGCSPAYLSSVYNGQREPGKAILDHLNLEEIVTVAYRERRWR
jgi:hypothetical protein